MQGYITIKEASTLTGKHADTIRRLIRENKESKYVARDKKDRVLVDRQWLLSNFDEKVNVEESAEEVTQENPSASGDIQTVITALNNQLEAKDKQIAELLQANREKEANQTKLADQFQQIIAGLQIPANTQPPVVVEDEPVVAQAEVMQTEVKVPMQGKRKAKKPVRKVRSSTTPAKPRNKSATAKKPAKKVVTKPASTKAEMPKKRWWSRG